VEKISRGRLFNPKLDSRDASGYGFFGYFKDVDLGVKFRVDDKIKAPVFNRRNNPIFFF